MRTIIKITPIVLLLAVACKSPQQKEQTVQKPTVAPDTSHKKQAVNNSATIMKELENKFGAKKQTFTIDNLKDTLIKGAQGTCIFLPKGCFIPSSAKMKLVLKEVYELKDFVYNNLTTVTTDGSLLSSNGMIYLDVESDEKVVINPKNPVKIKFPSADKDPSDLFLAVKDANGTIKWQATGNNTLPTKKPLISQRNRAQIKNAVDSTFYESTDYSLMEGGSLLDVGVAFCYKGYDTIRKGLEYPASLKTRKISGPVYIDLTVDAIGELENVKLIQGLNKEIDDMIISAVKRKKEWVPGFVMGRPEKSIIRYKFQVNGKDKDYNIELPRQIYHMSDLDSARYKYWLSIKGTDPRLKLYENKKKFDNNLKSGSSEVVQLGVEQGIRGYIYPLLNLGDWINCDKLVRDPGKGMQAQLIIKPSAPSMDMTVLAIFSDRNRSALYLSNYGNVFKSPLVSKSSKVTLVGIASDSDFSPVLFVKHMNGIANDTLDAEFKKVTYKELKQAIDNIKG